MKPLAFITGGAIGIGRATGLAFGKAGYRVIVTDVLEKEGSEAARGHRSLCHPIAPRADGATRSSVRGDARRPSSARLAG